MKFIKISSPGEVSDYLYKQILDKLENRQKALWLIAGGSAMDIAVQTAQKLSEAPNLNLLTITLTDERYGTAGHADSNWKQLKDRRFDLPGAYLLPVLNGRDFETTARQYDDMLNQQLKTADFSVALGGMGPDGHIFGIKPRSPAVDNNEDVVAYKWDDYERLTPTINFIKKLDEVVIYAAGPEKHAQFDLLDNKDVPAEQQPAQLLKKLPKVIIFNDYKGDKL